MLLSSSSAIFTDFYSWCDSRGIITPLQITGIDTPYRYMTCDKPQDAGTILGIPLTACQTADTPEQLAEQLLFERNQGSKSEYAPYLNVLPTLEDDGALQDMPRFWSSSRLDAITDSGMVQSRVERDARPRLDPWAHAIVSSRSNYLNDYSFALTPVLDMLNHDATIKTRAKIDENQNLLMSTDAVLNSNEEVFISYGDLSNLDTLCDYGFVSSTNPVNTETLPLRTLLLPGQTLQVTIHADGSIDGDTLLTLRKILANAKELEEIEEKTKDKGSNADALAFSRPVSDRNELEVQALVSAFVYEEVDTARNGAKELSLRNRDGNGDDLVMRYLSARADTLQNGLNRIKKNFPDAF